jgi:diacylglycerol kinase (ATP)
VTKPPSLVHSFRVAGRGVVRTVATQRHMKIHVTSAVLVMIVGMALPLDLASRTALLFCVALVFFAEILNTALEAFVDLHVKQFHREAMVAKDAAAAGVLVLALATIVILAAILHFEWDVVAASPDAVIRSLMFGLPLTGVVILLLWGPRRMWARAVLALGAFFFAVPLWVHSEDPVFSICLGGLVVLAALARPPAPDL